MPAILMLILMLSYLHTDYSDTDADLCIKIMSLCFTLISHASTIEDSLYFIFGYENIHVFKRHRNIFLICNRCIKIDKKYSSQYMVANDKKIYML